MPPELLLYYMPNCPFCQRVLHFIEEEGMTIPMKNINEKSEYRNELIEIGGKSQVPCLIIDGKPLHESDDIIQWLGKYKESW